MLFSKSYNTVNKTLILSEPGNRIGDNISRLPFDLRLESVDGQEIPETYHGVRINVEYFLKVEIKRGLLSQPLMASEEIIVIFSPRISKISKEVKRLEFDITPKTLKVQILNISIRNFHFN